MLGSMNERRDFRLLLVSTLLTTGSFGLLLPVVPLWAQHGGAAPAGVGATNATFLLATVAAQLTAPAVLRLLGHRETLVIGALLFGLPVFAYAPTTWLPALILVSALRGVGFAWLVVTGSALVARLLPAYRRGRGLGQLGVAIGVPNLVWLPAGPSLTTWLSFPTVFVVGGVLPLVGALVALPMRIRTRVSRGSWADRPTGRTRPVRLLDLTAPLLVMCATAVTSSAFVTFLPAALDVTAVATIGLLGYGVGALAGRWLAGVVGDRHSRGTLLVPGVVASAVGLFALVVVTRTGTLWIALTCAGLGGLVFGVGYGAVQNSTLAAMFDRVESAGYDVASTAWNMALDAGTGIGSLALGMAAGVIGYSPTFGAAAALLAVALPPAIVVARSERRRVAPT